MQLIKIEQTTENMRPIMAASMRGARVAHVALGITATMVPPPASGKGLIRLALEIQLTVLLGRRGVEWDWEVTP